MVLEMISNSLPLSYSVIFHATPHTHHHGLRLSGFSLYHPNTSSRVTSLESFFREVWEGKEGGGAGIGCTARSARDEITGFHYRYANATRECPS